MVTNEKRNYMTMIGKINDGFVDNGWADGYADFDSDEENIIKQLFEKISNEELFKYVNEYLNGYEVGKWMSENTDQIYDDDGNLREDLDLDSYYNYYDEIHQKILSMVKDKKI